MIFQIARLVPLHHFQTTYSAGAMKYIFPALIVFGSACAAAAQSFSCAGQTPDWQLNMDSAQARMVFPATTEMDVKLATPAEGQDWPRAYTLVGERDTAIVVIEQENCSDTAPFRAHVLTQRGQTPIFLTGCCTSSE